MRPIRSLLCASMLLAAVPAHLLIGQTQPAPSGPPTLSITSNLVFLDVTVLDKQGHPVTTGLGKDDFVITEDKRPQRIFSFEAPDEHVMDADAAAENPDGKAPVTVIVLDLLNSSFEDMAFIRYSVRRFLSAQPAQLAAPVELMAIGNQSLELLQGYTRSRQDLLTALGHLRPAVPYKWMSDAFIEERFDQSIDALHEIALQNRGVQGRKNIIWVGHGGPSFNTENFTPEVATELQRYMHATTNVLVDARISLFVIYPGLKVGHFFINQEAGAGAMSRPLPAGDASANIGDTLPFADDINFGVFVNETGGNLFYNRNDVDMEIARSQQLGSQYYTLTYQPHDVAPDGKFRRIRVTLRNPNLHVITKAGYFAPDKGGPVDPRLLELQSLATAVESGIPYTGLDMSVSRIVHRPDSPVAELTVQLKGKNLDWTPAGNNASTATVMLAAASLNGNKEVVASSATRLTLSGPTHDPARLAALVTPMQITVRVPHKTRSIRVVVSAGDAGRIGAADLDRKAIDGPPAAPVPQTVSQPVARQPIAAPMAQ